MKIGLYYLEPAIVNTAMINRYQKDSSRWVNNKIEFKNCTWEEYQEKMGRNYGKS